MHPLHLHIGLILAQKYSFLPQACKLLKVYRSTTNIYEQIAYNKLLLCIRRVPPKHLRDLTNCQFFIL